MVHFIQTKEKDFSTVHYMLAVKDINYFAFPLVLLCCIMHVHFAMFIDLWQELKCSSSICLPWLSFPCCFPLLFISLICSFPNESFNSLILCFASMRLSLSAPYNTLILASSFSKSLNLCSNPILLLLHLNRFSKICCEIKCKDAKTEG